MIFPYTVRYKRPGFLIFRRIRRAFSIQLVKLATDASDWTYKVSRITKQGKAAVSYVPFKDTVIECGRLVEKKNI